MNSKIEVSGIRRILYFIQLPPPIHGVSIINDFVCHSSSLNYGFEKEIIRINYSKTGYELGKWSCSKIYTHFSLTIKLLIRLVRFRPSHVYFSIVPTGLGFARDLLFVTIYKLAKVKPIYHLHGTGIDRATSSRCLKYLYEKVFNNSAIILLSEGLKSKELHNLTLPNTKIFVAENGVKSTVSLEGNRRNDKEVVILFLSKLSPSKGLIILLESFLLLHPPENKRLKLLLVGIVPDNRIKRKVDEYKRKSLYPIELLGDKHGDEKSLVLKQADIFVHPTLHDTFPLVLLEAMQAKLPIVSTYEGAIPEIIINEESGLLVEKSDIFNLTLKIQLLIDNNDLRCSLAENAYKRYTQNFTLEIFEKKMCQIFDSL